MTKLTILALMMTLSSAHAASEFGGIKFHSTVPKNQVESLKNDLRYLYTSPIASADRDFLKVAEFKVGDGPNMHNWLLNRIRYIYGESFEFEQKNMILIRGSFPSTPLPEFPSAKAPEGNKPKSRPEEDKPAVKGVTVMSNMGGAFYVIGKMNQAFIGFNFDGEKVFIKSPRTGVLQVGEGLFLPRFLFNKDVNHPSNSISRMSTLFHEARHSDGHGKHTAFMHAMCPKGHRMDGNYACEAVANGPYTIGGLSQRHLLKNCDSCSAKEKAALAAGVADSFGRIIDATFFNQIRDYRSMVRSYKSVADTYKELALNASEEDAAKYTSEVIKIEGDVQRSSYSARDYNITYKAKPLPRDPSHEGIFTPVSLSESMKIMEKSLGTK